MFLETGILFLVLSFFVFWRKKPQKFPPGPFSWPIVGNLLQIGKEPHKSLMAMKKTYGGIIGIDWGMKRAVCLMNYELVKEAFSMPVFCGRPEMQYIKNPKHGGNRGIALNTGSHAMEQKRFVFASLQSDFRNGASVEKVILNEAIKLIDNVKLLCGIPVSTSKMFDISIVNSFWTTVAGKICCTQDEKFSKLTECTNNVLSSTVVQGLLLVFPLLTKLAPKLSGYEFVASNMKPLHKFAQDVLGEHQCSYQEGVERDLVDKYLQKIQNTTDSNSSFFKTVGMENLCQTLVDLYVAGTETVITSLRWIIFLMAKHPEVQEKLNHEIANYKRRNGDITLKDRRTVPYVEAVILELLRFSSVAPFGIFHETIDTAEFHGYLIPKGTLVIAHQFGIHHDPDVWGDPENFRPERFLTYDGAEVIRHQPVIAFSTGKRICPGESLARDELYIFIVKLFESFTVEFDPSEPVPAMKGVFGTTLVPPEHKVVFKNRVM